MKNNDVKMHFFARKGQSKCFMRCGLATVIVLLMMSSLMQGQTSFNYTLWPVEKTYIYYVDAYNSYYSSDYSGRVGRYQPNDQEVYKYRKGLRFDCGSIPSYATVTQSVLHYNVTEKIGLQLGGIKLTSISNNFLTFTDSDAYAAIWSGSQILTKSITKLGTDSFVSASLKPIIQSGVQASNHNIGIGIYNTLEFEGGGITLLDCHLSGTYTIPTPGAVRNLTVSSITATSCTVSWDAPLIAGGAGAATLYKVKKGSQLYTTTTSTSVQITGLCPGTSYTFYVIANNQYGDGPTTSKSVTTSVTAITGANILCSSGGSYSLVNLPSDAIITWNPPSSNITRTGGEHSNPCTFQGQDWGGAGTISATINSATCGIYQVSMNVWSGRPWAPTVYPSGFPPEQMGIYSLLYVAILTSPGANQWEANWSSSGSISTTVSQGSNGMFESFAPGTGYFYVTTYNICGAGPMYQGEVFVDQFQMNSIYFSNENSELIISPNPASDEANITITEGSMLKQGKSAKMSGYLVNIIDISGRIIYSSNLKENTLRLPLSKLDNGTYYVVVTDNQKTWKGSLVVSH